MTMASWTACPQCGLKHSTRPDNLCPRCHTLVGALVPEPGPPFEVPFVASPPEAVSAPPPRVTNGSLGATDVVASPPPASPQERRLAPKAATEAKAPAGAEAVGESAPDDQRLCQGCGTRAQTRHLTFRQNVGLLVLRYSGTHEGDFCKRCAHDTFWRTTGITAVAGWWGIISFFVTPIFILGNIAEIASARYSGQYPRLAPPPPTVTGSHRVLKSSPAVTVLSILLIACSIAFLAFVALTPEARNQPRRRAARGGDAEPSPGAQAVDAFHAANEKVLTSQGQTAFGNSPAARAMAEKAAEAMRGLMALLKADGAPSDALSLTKGESLVFVEARQGKVCFLVHFPGLRNYSEATVRTLVKLVWKIASGIATRAYGGGNVEVAVGLRGVLLYGGVGVGSVSAAEPNVVEVVAEAAPQRLVSFFDGPEARGLDASLGAASPAAAPSPEPARR